MWSDNCKGIYPYSFIYRENSNRHNLYISIPINLVEILLRYSQLASPLMNIQVPRFERLGACFLAEYYPTILRQSYFRLRCGEMNSFHRFPN